MNGERRTGYSVDPETQLVEGSYAKQRYEIPGYPFSADLHALWVAGGP